MRRRVLTWHPFRSWPPLSASPPRSWEDLAAFALLWVLRSSDGPPSCEGVEARKDEMSGCLPICASVPHLHAAPSKRDASNYASHSQVGGARLVMLRDTDHAPVSRPTTKERAGGGPRSTMDLSLVEPAEDKTGKRVRCGECQGCMGEDCGHCANCADKPKFGGAGTPERPETSFAREAFPSLVRAHLSTRGSARVRFLSQVSKSRRASPAAASMSSPLASRRSPPRQRRGQNQTRASRPCR